MDSTQHGSDLEEVIRTLRHKANAATTSGAADTNRAALLRAEVDFVDKQRIEIKQLVDAYEKSAEDRSMRFDKLLKYAIQQESELRVQLSRPRPGSGSEPVPAPPPPGCDPAQQQSGDKHPRPGQQVSGAAGAIAAGVVTAAHDENSVPAIQRKVKRLRHELIETDHRITDPDPAKGTESAALEKLKTFDGKKHAADLSLKNLDALKAATKVWDDRLKAWQGLRDAADKFRQTEAYDYAYAYVLFLIARFATRTNALDPSRPLTDRYPGLEAAIKWLDDHHPATVYAPLDSAALMREIEERLLALLNDRREVRKARFEAEQTQGALDDARKALAELQKSGLERILQTLKPLPKTGA